MNQLLEKILERLKDAVYPRHCPVCDEIVGGGEKICADCMRELKLVKAPWCMSCGRPIRDAHERCHECKRAGMREFVRGRVLYEYPSVAKSIYRFKYGNRAEYAEFFGGEMAYFLKDFIDGTAADGIIPIPLHKKRMKKRGYNQAGLLAEELGKVCNIPVYDKLLIRVKNTAPLKMLGLSERQNNLKKAFNISQNGVKLKRVILVDDIYTTGSTIAEAAHTLRTYGVSEVYFVALACGEGI
ncbi:MAG: ComF family protein [Lachnospiraceae bacterium]|nr:ComF family protein [Lachnospiraceae bacterium]